MKNQILFGLIVLLMVFGFANAAATTSQPALQIVGYSTTPSTIYPGMTAQLQLTLENSGADTASRITLTYDNGPDPGYSSFTVGDIGPSGSTIASIPISIPSNVPTGIQLVHITADYASSDGATVKRMPATVSISVAQHQALEVKTVSINGTSVASGDRFGAVLEITNTGGVAKNIVIKTPGNSSFSLEGASQQTVGDIGLNQSKTVQMQIRSSSTSTPGRYMIPIVLEYEDSVQNTKTETFTIGPVNINDASTQFNLNLVPITQTEIGSAAQFELVAENRGTSATSAIIDFNSSSVFTPLGNSRIYIDSLAPGSMVRKNITIGIGASSSSGYYTLPITITRDGRSYTQNIGIEVKASQELTISPSTDPALVTSGASGVKVTAEIANTGNSPIRSVYATVSAPKGFEIVGSNDKFVGTLNVDDFTSFQFTVNVPNNLATGTYDIPLKIVYRDSNNGQHTENQHISIKIYAANDAARFTDVSAAAGTSGTSGFAARRSGATGMPAPYFGLGLPGLVIVLGILAVVGFFGYKRFIKKKTNSVSKTDGETSKPGNK